MKAILIDVMIGNHYECQISYPISNCSVIEVDNRVVPVINAESLATFIEAKKPSLKNKKYRVEFTNQKVL